MQELQSAILDEREELLVSPTAEKTPFLRTARFLRPTISSNEKELPKLPSLALFSLEPPWELHSLPLNLTFQGWRSRPRNWADWVAKMASLYELTWKKAGIYDAILSSTYQIKRNTDLILGLAEKWCCETKSFIFPWGEASVTLEDVMVLGGYSVLGSSVFSPLESEKLKAIEESLKSARMEIVRTKAKKASPHLWMEKFMDNGSEFEHEAFLTCWLSRYVFINARETIRDHVLPMAILLARGTRIALAPAVLACIYRDLCSLKDAIISSTRLGKEEVLALTLWSPFQLVQVWAWERFPKLRPEPNLINAGQPRLAKWREVNCKVENVRLVLDTGRESFEWRPYARQMENWDFSKIYVEKETFVSVSAHLDNDVESFIRCLRASELVGLDCIEQYLPNRVAMQFGMDQDIPAYVARSNENPEIAWSSYDQPFSHVNLIVPSCVLRFGVTVQYLIWWEKSVLGLKAAGKSNGKPKKSLKGSKNRPKNSAGEQEGRRTSTCTSSHTKGSIMSPESFNGNADGTETSVARNHVLKNSTWQALGVKGKIGRIDSDTTSPIKKSKAVEQLLKGNKLGNGGSTFRVTDGNSFKDLGKDVKGKKKGVEEFASSELPSTSSKEDTPSLKRKKEAQSTSSGPQQKHLKTSTENTQRKKTEKPNPTSFGFGLKILENSAENAKGIEHDDSASQRLSLRSLRKSAQDAEAKKEHFIPNFNGERAEVFIHENNPTIAEMLRSCKNHNAVARGDGDDHGHSSGRSQSLSSTVADNEVANYLEPLAILAERVMLDEAVLEGSGRMVEGTCEDQRQSRKLHDRDLAGGAGIPVEAANKENPLILLQKTPSMDTTNGEGSRSDMEVAELTLETRVSRLERLVGELRGETFDHK